MFDATRGDVGRGPFSDSIRKKKTKTTAKDVICLCQDIGTAELGACIDGGAHTLDEIQEGCGATVGACGGSCTPNVLKFLRDRLARLGTPPPKDSTDP